MTFQRAFSIARQVNDDWFDPKLHVDTDVFVDPFLMFDLTDPRWSAVHTRLVEFFNTALLHVARSGGDPNSREWLRAATMFSFPEPSAFCLGYCKKGIHGAGSARGLGARMLQTADAAVRAGITQIDDFGDLMLFGEHFGCDRISDMVCNIVMDLFVDYTQDIAARHRLPTETFTLDHLGYDFQHAKWKKRKVKLPRNPCWQPKMPVLLVPEAVLDELPQMDNESFWDWAYDTQNEQLRKELGLDITQHLDRRKIIAEARRRPYLTRRLGRQYVAACREQPAKPYNFERDPSFKVKPFESAQSYADEVAARTTVPSTPSEFRRFVIGLIQDFKWAVEERGLFRNFWSGEHPYSEEQAQDLFHLSILQICKLLDVDVSAETNAGRGPVDFKFSRGWAKRALVEFKFAKSSSFWDNLENQPKTYLNAEGVDFGVIVVVQHEDKYCATEFVERVQAIVTEVSQQTGLDYRILFIDVRKKPSASKIPRPRS